MINCPKCQTENQSNATFCKKCGVRLNPVPPQSVRPSVNSQDRRLRISSGRTNYRVTGVWRNDAPIFWVDREGDPLGAPPYLAVERKQSTGRNTFNNLEKLKQSHLAGIIGKGTDSAGRTYLVLAHIEGEPLDLRQPEMEWRRASAIFQQARELLIYLHEMSWSTIQTAPSPTMMERFTARVQRIEKWLLAEQEQTTPTIESDRFKRFQRAFALDARDNLVLVDYNILEPLPMPTDQRRERIFQDTRLAIGLLYWLYTAKRLTRDLQQLRQAGGQFAQLILTGLQEKNFSLQELGEAVAQLAPRQDPGRTVPLTMPSTSMATTPLPRPVGTQPLRFTLRAEALTDNGQQREHNEDNFLAQRIDDTSGIFLVADGMGGHAAGEVASKMAVSEIYKSALAGMPGLASKSPDEIRSTIAAWIQNANTQILNAARAKHNNMGTTLTGALILDGRAYVANVGDSRTYIYRFGQLYQLSRDHSLVASLIQAGMLAPEEAYNHPQRNEIFRSLGQQKDLRVDVYDPLPLMGDDRLLACSDGLWEMVHQPKIEEILKNNPDPQTACKKLIEAANTNGGEDNITAVIVQISFKS